MNAPASPLPLRPTQTVALAALLYDACSEACLAAEPAAASPGIGALAALAWQRLGSVALVLVLSFVAYSVVIGALNRAIAAAEVRSATAADTDRARQQRAVTVLALLASVVRWAIGVLALIWILAALGVNLLPVLTGVGFLGAAVAFGAQSLVRDIVTGFFVLLEGQYAVGDFVELNGKFGRVQSLGLRTTVLQDTRGQVHHIPNGTIAACTVYPVPSVGWMLRVPLSCAEDLGTAAQAVDEAAAGLESQSPPLLRVTCPATTTDAPLPEVQLGFTAFPTQDWVATTELPNRVKATLARLAVALPEGMAPHSDPALSPALLPGGTGAPDNCGQGAARQ